MIAFDYMTSLHYSSSAIKSNTGLSKSKLMDWVGSEDLHSSFKNSSRFDRCTKIMYTGHVTTDSLN